MLEASSRTVEYARIGEHRAQSSANPAMTERKCVETEEER